MNTVILQHQRIFQVLFHIYIAELLLIYVFPHCTNPSLISPEGLAILLEGTYGMQNLHKNLHYGVKLKTHHLLVLDSIRNIKPLLFIAYK